MVLRNCSFIYSPFLDLSVYNCNTTNDDRACYLKSSIVYLIILLYVDIRRTLIQQQQHQFPGIASHEFIFFMEILLYIYRSATCIREDDGVDFGSVVAIFFFFLLVVANCPQADVLSSPRVARIWV